MRKRSPLRLIALLLGLVVAILAAGAAYDILRFDQTSGGTPPDYADFTGEPIDWSNQERSADGFRGSGYVLTPVFNCTTGMISFEIVGLAIDFRAVSERGLAVHQPREACRDAGFDPQF